MYKCLKLNIYIITVKAYDSKHENEVIHQMNYNRILTIQDISCVGQCSLTVALPIISACGQECVILPSAVLSTHTGGFKNMTFRDLTDDMPDILKHWQSEEITFDAAYTGYLGSIKQIEYVKLFFEQTVKQGGIKIVDPAMADHGKLYSIFDMEYVKAMAGLCKEADIILPNITEAAFMSGFEYKESYDEAYIERLCEKLHEMGMKTIVLTGVSYDEATTGVLISELGGAHTYIKHRKLAKNSHGTGDIFASAMTGAYMAGKTLAEAVEIASSYVLSCMEATVDDESHWYGVKFEKCLNELVLQLT